MASTTSLEAALRHDRGVTIAALCAVIAFSWIWVVSGAGMEMSALEMTSVEMALGKWPPMGQMPEVAGSMATQMAVPARWSVSYALLMISMWWVMMLAMMLPSASPTILLFAALRRQSADQNSGGSTFAFAVAYGVVWLVFSSIAAASQWVFEATGLLSPMMLSSKNMFFAGTILIAAGIYQFSPLKQACLRHCSAPAQFIAAHWQKGVGGAYRMGTKHGLYCLGCCWALMAILFFGGIMNLWWIGGLAILVLLEKLMQNGVWIGRNQDGSRKWLFLPVGA